MTAPSSSPRPRVDQPSWEQLDELDALMQRMLALPINPPEEVPFNPPSSPLTATVDPVVVNETMPHDSQSEVRDRRPAADPSGAGASIEAPVLAEAPAGGAILPQFVPLDTKTAGQPAFDKEAYRSSALFEDHADRGTGPKAEAAASEPYAAFNSPPPGRPALQPLVLNRCFECLMGLLGPLCRALGGAIGRWLLGLAGLAMLAAAATWATLELGWIW